MTARNDRLDQLHEAARLASAGGDSYIAADHRPAFESDDGKTAPLRFEPFPVDALPEPMLALVVEGARAIGCDPSMIALPALAVCGAAIGGSRAVELKPGWIEFATVWVGVVARSGSAKSPAMKLALAPLHTMQSREFGVFDEVMDEYKKSNRRYKIEMKHWSGDGLEPIEPELPTCERLIVSDSTLEALAPILQENPRGVLVSRDELGAWLKSFGQYKGGGGGDVEAWLSIFDSAPMTIDRKTGRTTTHVEAPHVSICGTIQPAAMERALGEQHFENGLAARILLASPSATCPPFSRRFVSTATRDGWASAIENLLALGVGADDDGNPAPIVVRMSPGAERVWIDLHDELAERIVGADDRLAAALSKLRAYAARLSLIVHLTAEAGLGAALTTPTPIGVESAEAGCALARWFAGEAERLYQSFSESDEQCDRRELIESIGRKGGSVSVRDLQRSSREYPKADDARVVLDELVKAKLGNWTCGPMPKGGGKQAEIFTLNTVDTLTTDNRPPERLGMVRLSTVSAP